MSLKKILLSTNEEDEPPPGLKTDENYKSVGILNPAVVQYTNGHSHEIDLLSRLIYKDSQGFSSCIVRHKATLQDDTVEVHPEETMVFQSSAPHGNKGVEDFRVGTIESEDPFHGFLVHYDGFNARTEYVRTKESNPLNLLDWDRFGIYFPNISAEEAIDITDNPKYKHEWTEKYVDSWKELQIKGSPFLGTKDCCILPKKIERMDEHGKREEHYGIIIRLLPDMQIVYVKDFKELAEEDFWRRKLKNLDDYVLLERENSWEESHIGLSNPPFEIEEGIVIPYHGAIMNPERDYKFGLALVDKQDPHKILGRTRDPILYATEPWEENGFVSGKVVFPTGHASLDDKVYIFYGAGDNSVAYTIMKKEELLDSFNRRIAA
jgi:beta-1,2-mannobiose phosphorylase / 1,2-beta-oligomannan phosphorylase